MECFKIKRKSGFMFHNQLMEQEGSDKYCSSEFGQLSNFWKINRNSFS